MPVAASSNLRAIRLKHNLSAVTLATATGISRQTIYAIESGSFVPNTLIALKLAKSLNVAVEDLFTLPEETASARVAAQHLTVDGRPPGANRLVRFADAPVGKVAIPITTAFSFLPPADGMTSGNSAIAFPNAEKSSSSQLLLAGCDPALSLLACMAAKQGIDLILIPASSEKALQLLAEGKVHLAGSHLFDAKSRQYNLPEVRKRFAKGAAHIVTFASWQTGFVSSSNARRKVRSVADLAYPRVKFVNREKGSGCRAQFDLALKVAGLLSSSISGYDEIAYGHLPAAQQVANGSVDCCFANRAAALCFGLAFEPLQTERFDLIFPQSIMRTESVQALANVLASASFRSKLAAFAGYDSSHTGESLTAN